MDRQREIFQQLIRDRSQHPRHQGKTNPVHKYHYSENPYCGDMIELTLQLNHLGNRIEKLKFAGEGCALSIASADLMAEAVQGKTLAQALELSIGFRDMLKGENQLPQGFPKLNLLQSVSQFPTRVKCATLCWHTLKAALESLLNDVENTEANHSLPKVEI